jgi:hypothetical protein
MNSYQASARMQYAGFTLFVAGSMTGDESDMYSQFVRDTQPEFRFIIDYTCCSARLRPQNRLA